MAFVPSTAVSADPRLHYSAKKIATTKPRSVVVLYGQRTVPQDFHVERGAHGVVDTAGFTLPRQGSPDWSKVLKNPTANDGAVVAEIYAGYPHDPLPGSTDIAQLSRRFVGIVTDYKVSGTTDLWTFELSSLASLLTAEKQTTLSQGQTTLQYLAAVCKQAKLNVDISGLDDKFKPATLHEVFAQETMVGIHNIRPWSILQMCAEVDDCDVWVRDATVYYWSTKDVKRKHVVFQYGQDLVDLEGEHAPQFAKNIEVEVRTWGPKTRTSHTTRYKTDGTSVTNNRSTVTIPSFGTADATAISTSAQGTTVTQSTSAGGYKNTGFPTIPRESSKERHVIHKFNLTPDQADHYALLEWQKLSRLEYRATMKFPMTPEYLPFAHIETVHELYGCPWETFNSGSQIPFTDPDAKKGQPKTAVATLAAYFKRREVEAFTNEEGWSLDEEMLSHAPSSDAVDQ